MKVIPGINCTDFNCVKRGLEMVREIGADWAHIDISDGKFNPVITWNEPGELSTINYQPSTVNLEIHLMVKEPLEHVKSWLSAGAKRIIIHIESEFDFKAIKSLCDKNSVELMVAISSQTSVEEFFSKLGKDAEKVKYAQVLTVKPGYSGQDLQPEALEKISLLRKNLPNAKIEVDGGVNDKTIDMVKKSGADMAVSTSYISKSEDPGKAFRKLTDDK